MNESLYGAAYPFAIDPNTGKVAMESGDDKIRSNIRLILETRLGERPMLRNFGSRLPSLLQEVNDDVLADIIQNQTREALLKWEPRIIVTDTAITRNDGEISMRLEYMYTDRPVSDQMIIPLT